MTSIEDRIIAAYAELAYEPGGWVMLTRLRDTVLGVPRADMDAALLALYRDNRISLIAEVNQRALSYDNRIDAVSVGGDVKHLFRVR